MNVDSQQEWVIRFIKSRDKEAYLQLYRLYEKKVGSLLAKMTSFSQVEDLKQEVFIRIWRFASSLSASEAFSTWVYRITWNVAMDARKKFSQNQEYAMTEGFEAVDEVRTAQKQEDKLIVSQLLKNLDADSVAVLVMADLEDIPLQEVAQTLEIPVGTVKSRLFYARKKAREFLEKKGRRYEKG